MPRRLTHEEFINRLQQINSNIEVLGTYINSVTKIKCKCKIDGYIWEAAPSNLLQGYGCPKCGTKGTAQKNTLTYEEFMDKFHKQNKHAQDIELLEDYKGNKIKIKCKCRKCGYEWEATPNKLLQGRGCPKCNTSKGEKRIAQYLDNIDIDYIYDKRYFKDLVSTSGTLLRPDFIIPSLKIWIEFDGQQHFEPVNFKGAMNEEQVHERFKYTQQNDQIKDQYAKDNNWILIRIPYTDYANIEQILTKYLEEKNIKVS